MKERKPLDPQTKNAIGWILTIVFLLSAFYAGSFAIFFIACAVLVNPMLRKRILAQNRKTNAKSPEAATKAEYIPVVATSEISPDATEADSKVDESAIKNPYKNKVEIVAPASNPVKVERHKVAGTSYRQKEIQSLGTPNSDYDMTKSELVDCCLTDERIYEYEFSGLSAELIEEPDNPYDSNAIKVVVDGIQIGYIKKGSCAHIKKLMKANQIARVEVEISGGKSKLVYSNDDDYGNERYTLQRDRRDYSAALSIAVSATQTS